jgi:hypothetical protein
MWRGVVATATRRGEFLNSAAFALILAKELLTYRTSLMRYSLCQK